MFNPSLTLDQLVDHLGRLFGHVVEGEEEQPNIIDLKPDDVKVD